MKSIWAALLAFLGSKAAQAIEHRIAAAVVPMIVPVVEKAVAGLAAKNPAIAVVVPLVEAEICKVVAPPEPPKV